MANRKMHIIVGAAAGGASAYFLAREQEPAHQLVETLGGVLVGVLGGATPRHHRARASSTASQRRARSASRRWADQYHARRDGTENLLAQVLWWLAEMACRLISGALGGIAAGYLSHLVLDATTPMGLPLLA